MRSVWVLVPVTLASPVLLAVAWWKWAGSSPKSRALLDSQIAATLSFLATLFLPLIFLPSSRSQYQGLLALVIPGVLVAVALRCALSGKGPSRLFVILAASLWGAILLFTILFPRLHVVHDVFGSSFLFQVVRLLALPSGVASPVLLAVAWWRWAKSSPRSRTLLVGQIAATLTILSPLFAILILNILPNAIANQYEAFVGLGVPLVFAGLALRYAVLGVGPSRLYVGLAASFWMVFWVAAFLTLSGLGHMRL